MRLEVPQQNQRSSGSIHLDALRGTAALLVAVSHLRALFFVEYEQVQHKSLFTKMLYAVTGLGHDSVMVFFVLSGFLISSSVLRSMRGARWNWKKYAVQRLTRLYVVLLPALIIGGLWDFLGIKLLHGGGVYAGGGPYRHIIATPVIMHLSALDWLGNALFVQNILVPTFGSNGPLWSLNYEFWYYILFPVILLAAWPKTALRARLGYTLLAIAILGFVGKTIAFYFLIWLVGFAVGIIPSSRIGHGAIFKIFSGCCLVVSLFLSRFHIIGNDFRIDAVIAFCVGMFIYSNITAREERPINALYSKMAQGLSNVSYTMYLVHVPFLVFLNSRIIGHDQLWQPDPKHFLYAAGIAASTFLYTLLVWNFSEAKTETVRRLFPGGSRERAAGSEQKVPVNIGS